ncbi:NUDIX domain-containing protein [Microbacterium paulum]
MRLGLYEAELAEGSLAAEVYGATRASERHRHRYEVNNRYRDQIAEAGLWFSGLSPRPRPGRVRRAARAICYTYYIAPQRRPTPNCVRGRPRQVRLFRGLIAAALERHRASELFEDDVENELTWMPRRSATNPSRSPSRRASSSTRAGCGEVRSDTFVYGDDEIVRQYVDHPGAAAVVAIDDRERVLLIQQYRHPIGHRDWEIPAGLLDIAGEPPVDAARRELAEEADLDAERIEPLLSVFTTPGGNDEVVHIFLARGLRPASATFAREAEEADIRVEWVPLDDAVEAVMSGRMRNGILVAGILAAAELLRRS